MYDPLSNSDIYTSEWDLYLNEYITTIEEVEEIYGEGLITEEEYKEGKEFVEAKND